MFNARITMPAEAKAGEIVEIRVLTRHPMDRGGQSDGKGEAKTETKADAPATTTESKPAEAKPAKPKKAKGE